METFGPNPASGPTLGCLGFIYQHEVEPCNSFLFSSVLEGSGFPASSLGSDPNGTQPNPLQGGRGLGRSQSHAGRDEGTTQPPLPPSLPA